MKIKHDLVTDLVEEHLKLLKRFNWLEQHYCQELKMCIKCIYRRKATEYVQYCEVCINNTMSIEPIIKKHKK